jgi:CopG family transcriptional regulator, nickel-responsive regulator
MSDQISRFGVSIESDLLARFDELIRRRHYTNRSEAIRDLIRHDLVEEEWGAAVSEVIGTVTIVYDHHTPNLTERLNDFEHDHGKEIIFSSHVHLDHHNCLEILVVRGPGGKIRDLTDHLRSVRGVMHATLSMTTTGATLASKGHDHAEHRKQGHH